MAEVVVAIAIQKLGDFLVRTLTDYVTGNLALRNELKTNVRWLQDELGYMQSFLDDAKRKQEADRRVRLWISNVRQIAEDTTFLLDEFDLKIDGSFQKNGCIETVRFYTCSCRNKADISNMNDQIKSLKERVEAIAIRRETYGIRNLSSDGGQSSASMVKELRRTTSYVDAEKLFVGFEDVTCQLLDELLKMEPHRSVVSIHGMGGLGKTTLARSLYNSTQVHSHFTCRAWICVSQEYNIPDLLRSVFKSFKKGCSHKELLRLEKMNLEDLERHLRDFLRDKRYLVVVDDVWEREAWESLRRAFPDCHNHSRVIVTTRNEDVATRIDERVYVHHLRFLNPTESWNLFMGKILHVQEHDNWCSPAMQALGKEMVAKCQGLPLAVVVLGGLLSHKQNLEDWEQVKKHLWRHLAKGSIEISHLLSLSYDCLPGQLKQCFLYLGTFPEDYLFDATQLMYLWMGEQFVPPGEEMEDVAENYFNELINRSLIQVAERCWDKIAKCRIHDLLRDLAIEKASMEDLFHIYNPSTNHSSLVQQKRIVVHTQIQKYFSVDHSNKRLRSLTMHNTDKQLYGSSPQSLEILAKYNSLCLLKLNGEGWPGELPDVFGNLVQLKYLGLFRLYVNSLPPSIGKLERLETLEVCSLGGIECKLPRETSELKSLRHLICRVSGNADIGCLSSLRTLKAIKYDHWNAIKKENLVNLRELVIQDIEQERNGKAYILEPFTNFNKLHTLVLIAFSAFLPPLDFLSSCENVRTLWLRGEIEMLPPVEKWPTSITMLGLTYSKLKDGSILTLGRLPNLRRLDLQDSHKAETMVFGPNSFPQLETLNFFYLKNLKKLKLGEGAMPKIKRFHVSECDKLVGIPNKLKDIMMRDNNHILDLLNYCHPIQPPFLYKLPKIKFE